MQHVLDALVQERESLFTAAADEEADPEISTECKERVLAHVERLHQTLKQLQQRVSDLEAETAALRSLPPPPPIGMEEITAQQDVLEDLHARDEVLRRQLGALVHEKGRLNLQLQQRDRELRCLAEEKAAIVSALSAALKRVAAEKEDAQSGRTRGSGQGAHTEQMVASQKRTIESLRREVYELRRGNAGSSSNATSREGSTRAERAATERALRQELDSVREQLAMTTLQYRSDRASMGTQLAVLRSQLSDAEEQRDAMDAQLQTQRDSANDLQRQLQRLQHDLSNGNAKADHAAGVALAQVVVHVPQHFPPPSTSLSVKQSSFLPWTYLTAPLSWLTGRTTDENHQLMAV